MFNLNEKFNELLDSYGLLLSDGTPRNYYELYLQTFENIWSSIPDDEPIAIYGLGEHTTILYDKIICRYNKKIVCIIENNKNDDTYHGIPVIRKEDLSSYIVKNVFIACFDYRDEVKQHVPVYACDAETIDIYDVLEGKGYTYVSSFARSFYTHCLLLERERICYLTASTKEGKQKSLMLLIKRYLYIRDIVYAKKYINEYIESRYESFIQLSEFLIKLESFFEYVKMRIKQKTSDDIIIFLIDGLSYGLSKNLPSLNKLTNHSLVFTNAYPAVQQTRGSFYTFLTGKNYVEDKLYQLDYLERSESPFLEKLKENGYKFKIIGVTLEYIAFLNKVSDVSIPLPSVWEQSYLYWGFLSETLANDEDSVFIVYSGEPHVPFFSGYIDLKLRNWWQEYLSLRELPLYEKSEKFQEIVEYSQSLFNSTLDYVDKQLDFYLDFIDKDRNSIIFMSDHGGGPPFSNIGNAYINPDFSKLTLMLCSPLVPPGKYDKIFSLINLPDIIEHLLWGKGELPIKEIQWMRMEKEPAYAKLMRKGDSDPSLKGYIRFFNDEEDYTLFLDGTESYKRPPEQTELIDDERYSDIIENFRSMIHVNLKDVWNTMLEKYPAMREFHDLSFLERLSD